MRYALNVCLLADDSAVHDDLNAADAVFLLPGLAGRQDLFTLMQQGGFYAALYNSQFEQAS